jgi:elongation factor Ts
MAEISATAVRTLREKTGLPLMDCKRALQECGGDEASAIDWLRKQGMKTLEKRSGRETAFGRIGIFASFDPPVGAMVVLKCESAPVTQNVEFLQLAADLARQLARSPKVESAEELLDQPSPSNPGQTLRQVKDDLFNRIREVFNVGRIARIDGSCAGYEHPGSTVYGVLCHVAGGNAEAARNVCMHIAALRPKSVNKEELDSAVVEKEREILREAARKEGKPENVIDKMVEGRLRNFYGEIVLNEQPYVKEPSLTVGKYAEQQGMKVKSFILWELGKE